MLNDVKLNSMSAKQIRIIGMQALEEKLGVEGTIRFLEQFDNGGSGDYTKEKYDIPEENYDNFSAHENMVSEQNDKNVRMREIKWKKKDIDC